MYRMGDIILVAKISNIFRVLEIPFFGGWGVGGGGVDVNAGLEPTYEGNSEYPPSPLSPGTSPCL